MKVKRLTLKAKDFTFSTRTKAKVLEDSQTVFTGADVSIAIMVDSRSDGFWMPCLSLSHCVHVFICVCVYVYRYSGRTQKQLSEFVRENCVKRPPFHRYVNLTDI